MKSIECPNCDGLGEVIFNDENGRNEELCCKCKGSGEIEQMKSIDQLSVEIHDAAMENGWWETRDIIVEYVPASLKAAAKANIEIAALGLAMGECGEAMDAIRKGYPPDDKLPQYGNHAVEIADAIIRLLDLTAKMNIPIGEIIEAKLEVNRKRGHMHGGKIA